MWSTKCSLVIITVSAGSVEPLRLRNSRLWCYSVAVVIAVVAGTFNDCFVVLGTTSRQWAAPIVVIVVVSRNI